MPAQPQSAEAFCRSRALWRAVGLQRCELRPALILESRQLCVEYSQGRRTSALVQQRLEQSRVYLALARTLELAKTKACSRRIRNAVAGPKRSRNPGNTIR